MKKILITGSTGFIGSNIFLNIKNDFKIYLLLRRKLRKKKINFIKNQNIKIINFKNYDELNFKIKKITVDVIIHCATYYVKKHKDKDISKIIDSNILFPNIILKNLNKNIKLKLPSEREIRFFNRILDKKNKFKDMIYKIKYRLKI